jgi:hypothetical protein
MTNQANTTTRELNLEDLDRVSGAGIRVPDFHGRKPPGSDASVAFPPGPSSMAGMRGVVGPEV